MTRLERKQAELDKLYRYKAAAVRNNDLMWFHLNQDKIAALEAEVAELRKYEPQKLRHVLADREECVKHDIYKALLRVSLVADVVYEASFEAKSILSRYGIIDFHFAKKVDEIVSLSKEVAGIPIAGGEIMESFIVDNEKFVGMCMKHADAYIKRRLKL